MSLLENRTALITGAGSGIGRATAERFALEGAAVVCADINTSSAEETVNYIEQRRGRATALLLDVTDKSAVDQAIDETISRYGSFDILFNNAGIGGGDWDTTIAVNLTGVFNGLACGAPRMRETGGSIINTASVAGLVGLVGPQDPNPVISNADLGGIGGYIASKHGVAGLTKQYALVFGRFGVRVNAIAPGYIETPMTANFREVPDYAKFLESLHALGRMGQPEEIASAATFLASDDASFITGVVLPVDGGYTAR